LDQEIIEECNYLHTKVYAAYTSAVATSIKRDHIERSAMTNDLPHFKRRIAELEIRMHLAPM